MRNIRLLSFCFLSVFAFTQMTLSAVLIAEVGNDPTWGGPGPDSDPLGEYIIICNTGPGNVNIQDYTFTDNSGTMVTIVSTVTILPPDGCFLVIRDSLPSTVFDSSHYNCTTIPTNNTTGVWTNNLSNGSDRVRIFDSTMTEIDAMSYGGDTYAFTPSLPDNVSNQGIVYRRNGYPMASAMIDTNSDTDWSLVNIGMGMQSNYGDGVSPCSVSLAPTAAAETVEGRVQSAYSTGISRALVSLQDTSTGEIRSTFTNPFGYFSFPETHVGELYVLSVQSRQYQFSTNVIAFEFFGESSRKFVFTADARFGVRPQNLKPGYKY